MKNLRFYKTAAIYYALLLTLMFLLMLYEVIEERI